VVIGFFWVIVGVIGYLVTGPTIWIWYPWVGLPNPFAWLRPLAYVFMGIGAVLALYGFMAGGEE